MSRGRIDDRSAARPNLNGRVPAGPSASTGPTSTTMNRSVVSRCRAMRETNLLNGRVGHGFVEGRLKLGNRRMVTREDTAFDEDRHPRRRVDSL